MANSIQDTDERVIPAALPGSTRSEQVVTGEQVEEILNHPGFQALAHALHVHGESLLNQRLFRKADAEGAPYADVMGHIRGLREVVPIARGLVQNGKDAGQALRLEEES
jgi:hypothetical protein